MSRLTLPSSFSGKNYSNTQHQLSIFMSPGPLYSRIPWHLNSTLSRETNSISLGWGGEKRKLYISHSSISAHPILPSTSWEYFNTPLLRKQRIAFLMSTSCECCSFVFLSHLYSLMVASLSFLHVWVISLFLFFCVNFPFHFPHQVWPVVGISPLYR